MLEFGRQKKIIISKTASRKIKFHVSAIIIAEALRAATKQSRPGSRKQMGLLGNGPFFYKQSVYWDALNLSPAPKNCDILNPIIF